MATKRFDTEKKGNANASIGYESTQEGRVLLTPDERRDVRVTTRITALEQDQLEALAAFYRVPVSTLIRDLIATYLTAQAETLEALASLDAMRKTNPYELTLERGADGVRK